MTKLTFLPDETGGVSFEIRAHLADSTGGVVGGIFSYNTTSFFIHDEIDFEALSNDPERIQTNIYSNDPHDAGQPSFHELSGSLLEDHNYRIEWYRDAVLWYVDDSLIRITSAEIPQHPQALHLNIWAPAADWVEAYNPELHPVTDPVANTSYYFDIDSVQVTRLNDTWYYDVISPAITRFSPPDSSTDVFVWRKIEVSFNEEIQFGAGEITLMTVNGLVVEKYTADSGNMSLHDHTLRIDPTVDLSFGTDYQLIIGKGAVMDLAGNEYEGSDECHFSTGSEGY